MPIGIYSGTYTTTITLRSIYNPATVTATGFVNVNTPVSFVAGVYGGLNGATYTLVNQGTIQSIGNQGLGVNLAFGGSVANTGLVQGTEFGVAASLNLPSGPGKVTNSGTIAQIGVSGGAGVILSPGGTVTNTGLISSQGTSSYGVSLISGGNVINGMTNSSLGLIAGYVVGVSIRALYGNPGTITNYGTIQSTKSTSAGPFTGFGVQLSGVGTVNNFGAITAAQTSGGAAISLNAGGIVTNNAGALVQGGGSGITVNGTVLATVLLSSRQVRRQFC